MNKTELIAAVAEKAELSKKDAEKAVKAVLDSVEGALKAGENYLFVTVKDAWGGREWNCGFRAHWN